MWIDVCIPFDEKGELAMAYNRALRQGDSEWILFLDHDVFLCNPRWYEMSLEAIESVRQDPLAVCIGCECGGEHHKRTMKMDGPPNTSIKDHINESKRRYGIHGNMIERIYVHVPGFFMLLKRDVACEIGFVHQQSGINNIDTDFGERLIHAGYHIYQMRGLYIYHRRGMKKLKKEFTTEND